MKPIFFLSVLFALFLAILPARSQELTHMDIRALHPNSQVFMDLANGEIVGTGGVSFSNREAVITADRIVGNDKSGEVRAEGHITILGKNHIFEGTNIVYNTKTGELQIDTFKAAALPFFIEGTGLNGSQTNGVYLGSESTITTDDYEQPLYKIRARILVIVPGQYIEAYQATLYLGSVPVMYVPHYKRRLGRHPYNYSVIPGFQSSYGAFLLNSFNWYIDERLDGTIHGDWRSKRGLGGGPDVNFHLGQYGDGSFRYYYAHDQSPNEEAVLPVTLPTDRQRASFNYFSEPYSNFVVKVNANYQSDPQVLRDFFESEYRTNIQPASVAEVTKIGNNYTLDAVAQPQLVNSFETVERLPDLKLTEARQQVGVTPIYYEGESSFGYFRHRYSSTNNSFADYAAGRGDTYHQFVLPQNYFGFLNVIPRVGGRVTYYTQTEGATNFASGFSPSGPGTEQVRTVFNTGAEFSTKASQVWRDPQNDIFDVNGLRHIIEPSVNYVFVPSPSRSPRELPQFDSESPSLRLLPIDFPDYNTIDSIDSQNVLRLTLRNKLQTKREPGVQNLVNWALYTDLRLDRRDVPLYTDPRQTATVRQTRFSDVYSDLDLSPRSWLLLGSQVRYNVADRQLRSAIHSVTLKPNSTWSVYVSHNYLMNDDPEWLTAPGTHVDGNNLFSTGLYYKFNENWGAHIGERFEARDGTLEEQSYTIYRDLRSWTAAMTLRMLSNHSDPFTGTHRANEVSVVMTMSLKTFPRFGMGNESEHGSMLGY